MYDLPSGPRLLALARAVLSEELMPLLRRDRQAEARRAAAAIAIAEREAAAGEEPFQALLRELAAFYGIESPSPQPSPRNAGSPRSGRVRGDPTDLLRRFADDLRQGAFAASPVHERAARALLWRLTLAKLRRSNPQFLAANGFA